MLPVHPVKTQFQNALEVHHLVCATKPLVASYPIVSILSSALFIFTVMRTLYIYLYNVDNKDVTDGQKNGGSLHKSQQILDGRTGGRGGLPFLQSAGGLSVEKPPLPAFPTHRSDVSSAIS